MIIKIIINFKIIIKVIKLRQKMIRTITSNLKNCILSRQLINKQVIKYKFCSNNVQPQKSKQKPQQPNKQPQSLLLRQKRICSQLNELSKSKIQNQKLKIPSSKQNHLQTFLSQRNFKIKRHEKTRIQFYCENTKKEIQNNNFYDVKIFINANKQMKQQERTMLDAIFKDYFSSFYFQKQRNDNKEQIEMSNFMNFFTDFKTFKQKLEKYPNFGKNFQQGANKLFQNLKNMQNNTNNSINPDLLSNKFCQATIFIRNPTQPLLKPVQQKWVKLQILIQNWEILHVYSLQIIPSIQPYKLSDKDQSISNEYKVEAKQMKKQTLEKVYQIIKEIGIDSNLVSACRFYAYLEEHKYYIKWIEDIMAITK